MKKTYILIVFALTTIISSCDSDTSGTDKILEQLNLPDGFSVTVFAEEVPDARQLALSPNGIVYAGSRSAGAVYALVDEDGDYKADRTYTIARGLRQPSGVAFRDGALFVAAINRILRFNNIDDNLENPPDPVLVTDNYPDDGHHGWKYIGFGPDDRLYVPVGAPCNICSSRDNIYASITSINTDGSNRKVIANGVRNSVGFDWHPETGELWFTDNGRDWLGDDRPPDELNQLTEDGQHFGYPYKHGRSIWDPEFGQIGKKRDMEFRDPARELDPHVAALGMIFYNGSMFPEVYRGKIFVAEHGSWNRSEKIGYRITMVSLKKGKAASYESFIDGWLQQDRGAVWGRPVDLLELSDGSVLISDDHRGIIYRVTYNN